MSEGHPKEDARNRLGTWGGSEVGQSHHPGHHTGVITQVETGARNAARTTRRCRV